MNQVAKGKDPQADRRAHRQLGTFEELASRYVEEYAKKKNRSWEQAAKPSEKTRVAALGQTASRMPLLAAR